ncbi:LOW QUALITY PROTEIN: hypothetical protein PHMEG_00036125 [Phytophthora megakarya]|uniref:Uncharacterized protein n=1 Tax=Phytophthora megakarya TaxID=4795 RepID=A0A225UMK6_9STRA|nr:LOW QUALITY PROTEIN: hypothetical protein PHMEG_00036125 [Phytophthora megakarya]
MVKKLREEIPLLEMQHVRVAWRSGRTRDKIIAFHGGEIKNENGDGIPSALTPNNSVFDATSDRFLWASATLSVVISEATLQNVFPHRVPGQMILKNSTGEDTLAHIRSKVLGKLVTIPYRLCFDWDETSFRVVRLETTLDLLSPLLLLVEKIEDAAIVLEHALIKLNGVMDET